MLGPHCLRIGQHIMPGDHRAAAGGLQDRAQDPQRRRLAGPVGPEQPEDRAGLAIKRDVGDRRDPAALIVEEALAKTFDLDHKYISAAKGGDDTQLAIASTRASAGSSSIYS